MWVLFRGRSERLACAGGHSFRAVCLARHFSNALGSYSKLGPQRVYWMKDSVAHIMNLSLARKLASLFR